MAGSTRKGPDPVNRLILIRHSKSDRPSGVADHDRPLSERGRRDAVALGCWLGSDIEGLNPDRAIIVVSSSERTQQTWDLARSEAGEAWSVVPAITEPDVYEAAPSTLRTAMLQHAGDADLLALVGHNPGVSLLALELVGPQDRPRLAEGFPTSAAVVLETDAPWPSALADLGAFRVSSFVIPRG